MPMECQADAASEGVQEAFNVRAAQWCFEASAGHNFRIRICVAA